MSTKTYVFGDHVRVDGSSQNVEELGQVLEVVAEHHGRVLLDEDGEVVVGDLGLHLILAHGQVGQEDGHQLVHLVIERPRGPDCLSTHRSLLTSLR